VPYDLTVKNLMNRISICKSLLKWNKTIFEMVILRVMKNRSHTTIMYEKDCGRSKVKLRKRSQSQDWC